MKKTLYWFCLSAMLSISLSMLYAQVPTPEKALKNLKWRAVGPANMGGRVTDIVGIPGDPSTFYVAGADGGVHKTTNGGATFKEIFINQKSYSVGALAIAPSDYNVVWLGSGEGDPRNSVGYGHGVYRSTDGGMSWTHLGLDKTDRIKRIVVHPNNPDVACVCALGREWGPNPDRGVFVTTDGGKTWEKTLYLDEDTGCSDIAMDLSNPRIIYAGMWTFRRKPWRFDDGGKKTAVYRSMDGGKTWAKIGKGLPEAPMARMGLAVAQSQPNTVYLITEFPNTSGTLFRSDDRGESWKLVNKDPNINFRPFYYSDVKVDPNNPEILYTLSGGLSKSMDGGKTFKTIARNVHGDHQSFWIDPKNSKRLLSGSDGGYQVSYDAGETWDIINNVELSQFYQILVDDRQPYYIYGGLQDNGTWFGPSNSLHREGIMKRHWTQLAGGDGYYAVPVPGNEHEVFANLQGGVIFHVDTRTGNTRTIHPYPNKIGSAGDAVADHKYRFNWDSPIHISPHDPNTVYTGGNVIFKSSDRGYSWEVISPDLTTNDKSKQQSSGGEIYQDNTAAEFHCTILTIAESPKEKGVIWAGTDDGNVQLTRDGGKTWTKLNANIKGMPAFGWVGKIHASEHDAGTAFIAIDNHRLDDYKAWAFMTTDYGKTWTKISDGLPEDWVYVVRQDPKNPDLLYAGMEHGIFASWDKGKTWTKINMNLPNVSVRDLRVQAREADLIVGTHGRGAWVLDDIRPLQEFKTSVNKDVALLEPRPAMRWQMYSMLEDLGDREYVAKNPEYGAYVNYYIAQDAKEPVKLDIKDASGAMVYTLTDSTAKAGFNRLIWDLRGQAATKLNRPVGSGGWGGGDFRPLVVPGVYTAVLTANGKTLETKITVKGDPRLEMSDEDYQTLQRTIAGLQAMLSQTHELINNSDAILEQLDDLKKKIKGINGTGNEAVISAIDKAIKDTKALQDELRRPAPAMSYRQKPALREEIRSLMSAMDSAAAKPAKQQTARVEELKQETNAAINKFESLLQKDIAAINQLVQTMPQIAIKQVGKP
ncbi:MAG: VPS10 domain-containing protein [Saprospiraceae bacterium]